MKTKSIDEIIEEIENMQEEYSDKYITGDQFEEWLKSKKDSFQKIEDEGHLSEEGQKAYNEILDEIFEDTDINIFDELDKEE